MPSRDVHVGLDDWLFLLGGSNDVGKLFCDPGALTQAEIGRWRNLLAKRSEMISAAGALYLHFFVPDKLSVYPEQLGSGIDLLETTPVSRLLALSPAFAAVPSGVIDILPEMLAEKRAGQLYWKTDTHWTFAGGFVALRAICEAAAARVPVELLRCEVSEVTLTLDLGSKLEPPVTEVWSAPRILTNAVQTYKNQMVKFLELLAPRYHGEMHVGTSVGFRNENPKCDPRSVLIFGDSYCEYRPHSLTGMLAEAFREVRFVWSSSIDFELLNVLKPDIVITELAERFIKRVPNDEFSLQIANYEKISAFLNRQCGGNDGLSFSWTLSQ